MSEGWPATYDEIRLTGLRARGHHGVLAHERTEGQEFVVDVVLAVDVRAAARSDALADTVDYGALAVQVHEVVTGDAVDLIETLAQRVADRCLATVGVLAVEVVVHKPQAPITVPFDDVAVRIVRAGR